LFTINLFTRHIDNLISLIHDTSLTHLKKRKRGFLAGSKGDSIELKLRIADGDSTRQLLGVG
jgi:hypothetical protein